VKCIGRHPFVAVLFQIAGILVVRSSSKRGLTVLRSTKETFPEVMFHSFVHGAKEVHVIRNRRITTRLFNVQSTNVCLP